MPYKPDFFRHRRKNPVDKLRENAELDHGIYVGEVIVRPKDDTNSGRIPVYIPMLSKDRDDPTGYFNCYWSSPFAGSTPSEKIGKNVRSYDETIKTYGMWMVPPDPGNFVLVIFGDGKKKFPIIIGCLFPDQSQHMVPGIPAGTTYGSSLPLPVAEKNKRESDPDTSNAVNRPLHHIITKSILDQGLINDPIRGISTSGARRESPSQVYGILTPGPEEPSLITGKKDGTNRRGGHSFVMDDNLDQRHIRLRTGLGNQILMDDTNGLIYVINSKGTAWVELAEDGSIHVFSDKNINMRSTESINFHADKDINIEAEENINIRAGLYQNGDDKGYGKIKLEASDSAELLATNDFNVTVENELNFIAKANYKISAGGDGHLKVAGTHMLGASDIMESASGEINSQAGGNNNILGSNVNLNNGGSATSPEDAKQLESFEDLGMSMELEDVTSMKPGWDYDERNPGESNPLPTEGERDGEEIPNLHSINTVVPTREPWAGHASATAATQDPAQMTSKDEAVKNTPTNAISQSDTGPAAAPDDSGGHDIGTGYAPEPGNPPPGPQSAPLYKKSAIKSMPQDVAQVCNNMHENGLADAGAQVLQSAGHSIPVPVTNSSGRQVVGYGHILDNNEISSGVSMFGDGKILDPQSGFQNPGMKLPASDYADIIMNETEQGIKRYGLTKILGGNGSYAIDGTKNSIVHRLSDAMTTDVSKALGMNGLSTTGRIIAGSLTGSTTKHNRNSILAMTLFGNSIGENNWYGSDVRNAINQGSANNLVPQLMNKWITNSVYRPTLKQRRVYEATLYGMPDLYDVSETPRASGMGWGILANRLRRKQYEYFAADGMRPPGGIYIGPNFNINLGSQIFNYI